ARAGFGSGFVCLLVGSIFFLVRVFVGFFFFLMIRRPPRSTLFPTRRSSDLSRLLAPGGLVEEAALRREITLLAEAKDVRRVAMLTRQYSTRFAASLYAADFFRELAGAIARLGLADDPANYQLLSNAAAALPP